MRHSGRVLRPPGPDFPEGLFPDLWGFGASPDLPRAVPHARGRPSGTRGLPPRRIDPLAAVLERIGRLFG